jgi:hypothetical protein
MFLEIEKDVRTNFYKTHRMVTVAEMLEKHPYCMDLRGWAQGGRPNTRFGLANERGNFLYVKTEENDPGKLEALARSL